jgi:LssY C-terminus
MPTVLRKPSLLFAILLALTGSAAINTAIDPHVDREREWIETDLLYAGTATSYALVDRPHVPKTTTNATGDVITTDGQLSVLELGTTKPNIINPATPVLQTRPAQASR